MGSSPARRADRFVQRWQALDQTSQRQYEAGDITAHKETRRTMAPDGMNPRSTDGSPIPPGGVLGPATSSTSMTEGAGRTGRS